MTQSLKSLIQTDMKTAMKAKDSDRLGTIRMLLAAIKQREVDERIELSDTDIFTVINKMIKQRKESATQFRAGNRPELADKEEKEIEYLTVYLPQPLGLAEIEEIVQKAITEANATSIKDMGAVMNIVRPKLQGRADMSQVSVMIKTQLG